MGKARQISRRGRRSQNLNLDEIDTSYIFQFFTNLQQSIVLQSSDTCHSILIICDSFPENEF